MYVCINAAIPRLFTLILSFCLFRESVLYCKFKMQLVKFKCNNADQNWFYEQTSEAVQFTFFLWISSVHLKTDWWRFVVNCSFKPLHPSHSQSAEKRDICKVFNVTTIAFPAFLCWILTENRQDLNFLRREQQRERARRRKSTGVHFYVFESKLAYCYEMKPKAMLQNIWNQTDRQTDQHHKTEPGWPSG